MPLSLFRVRRALGAVLASSALASAQPAAAQIQTEFYIPIPENEALESLDDVNSGTDDPVQTFVSISVPNDCQVFYDHWEDGYEADLANPSQATSLSWGNGNDADGVPPGFASDPSPLSGGTVLVLQSSVVTGMSTGDEDPNAPGADAALQATIDFDGRDRVGTTCASSMTRAAWADVGTVNAGAVEVWPLSQWGTSYTVPIGQNTPNAANDFQLVNLSLMASQNGTLVQIDHDADGSVDVSVTLARGESYYLDSSTLAINQGATITASAPIQLDLLTGDEASSYAGRWYAVLPVSSWDGCYYSPTNAQTRLGSSATAAVRAFLYNPDSASLEIVAIDGNGTTTNITVPAGGSAHYDMPTAAVGAQLCSSDGRVFYAGASVDHGSVTHDWGYYMIPEALLTNQLLVPWADGCDPTISPPCTQNGSPVWVTPVCDTYVYVDFDLDGTPDQVDLNGDGDTSDVVGGLSEATSDQGLFVAGLGRILVHDPTDVSQTGALIYSLDAAGGSGGMGCDLAGVWGQNASNANSGSPSLDLGTLMIPFGGDLRIEKATNGQDADTPAEAVLVSEGSAVTWTYVVTNTGDFDLANVEVLDDQLPASAIVCDADNVIDLLVPGQSVTCTASGTATLGAYQNVGSATGTPVGVTGLPVLFDVSDMDPSNYLGVEFDLAIDKLAATLLVDADSTSTVTVGDTLSWEIEVSNPGTYPLTGVTVSDDTADTLACERSGGAAFDHVVGEGLAVGEAITCVATYVVTPADGAAGQVENVATTNSNETDEKTDTVTTPVVPAVPDGIEVVKDAAPVIVPPSGGDVTFTFTVTNQSATGAVLLTGLVDDVFGDLNGQGTCSVPQTLAASESYTCSITEPLAGAAGSVHHNTVTASGTDLTTMQPVSDTDPAQVLFLSEVGQACKHACPSKLFFRDGPDFFATEAKLEMPQSLQLDSLPFSIAVSNANGLVYQGQLLPGDLARKGRKYIFKDKGAKTGVGSRDGFFKVQAKFAKDGLWRFKIRLYDDLSTATLADMQIIIQVGGYIFARDDTWSPHNKGWQLRRFK